MARDHQRDRKGRPPFEVLIQHFPEAAKIVMDRSVQPSTSVNMNDPDYSVRYDFHLLDPGPDDPSSVKGRRFFAPTAMVKHGREQLLQHPLTTKLLEEKWLTFGRIPYYVNFFTYILFVVAYSGFIILVRASYEDMAVLIILLAVVLLIGFIHILKKILQLCIKRFKHVADITNLFEWALYSTTVLSSIDTFSGKTEWRLNIRVHLPLLRKSGAVPAHVSRPWPLRHNVRGGDQNHDQSAVGLFGLYTWIWHRLLRPV